MMKNKKADTKTTIIIGLILAIAVLVIFSNWMISNSKVARYETSIMECNRFFNNIPTSFFDNDGNPKSEFYDTVEKLCPSKSEEVGSNVRNVADLVSDCYMKAGNGVDFYSELSDDQSICLYCGKVTTKDTIEDFDEKFLKAINEDRYSNLFDISVESVNTNMIYLNDSINIPKTLEEDKSVGVFYYLVKPKAKECNVDFDNIDDNIYGNCIESLEMDISRYFSTISPQLTKLVTSTHAKSIGGVFLGSIEEFSTDGELDSEFGEGDDRVYIGDKKSSNVISCVRIVPEKELE